MVRAAEEPPELIWLPAPKQIIATAAPKDAPWETPRVEAEANGLRRTFCITHPDMARAAPTTTAAAMRGIRTFQMMVRVSRLPYPTRAPRICPKLRPAEPAARDARQARAHDRGANRHKAPFRRTYCR